ncbi:MAG TPA: MarR family transcriptional regulator [Bacillota bacterium]|nr:MarR family transcriptional regulator [Bacillota bacterium]
MNVINAREEIFSGYPIQHQCIALLIRVNREHRSLAESKVKLLGIHRSQHHMLMYLSDKKMALSQKKIADDMKISPAAVAIMIKKLEKNGYIKRAVAENDSRYNEIKLSEKGEAMIKKTKTVFDAIDTNAFLGFSVEEMTQFAVMLNRLSDNILLMSGGNKTIEDNI